MREHLFPRTKFNLPGAPYMLKRLAMLTALAVGSIAVAHADPITGTVGLVGSDSFTSNSIVFYSAEINGGSGANTGTFSTLTDGNVVQMFPGYVGSLPYQQGFQTVPSNISPVEVFSTTEGGMTFSYWMTDYTATYVSNVTGCMDATCLDVTGDGYFSATGYDNTNGTFTFTTQLDNGQSSTTFSASGVTTGGSPVPEPASLALVGTGIAGAAGLLRRRFAGANR